MINMAYGKREGVRKRLGEETDASDELIEKALTYADGYIDSEFDRIDESVPSTTPQELIDAAEDLATAFIYKTKEPEKANIYEVSGKEAVTHYVDTHYYKGAVA